MKKKKRPQSFQKTLLGFWERVKRWKYWKNRKFWAIAGGAALLVTVGIVLLCLGKKPAQTPVPQIPDRSNMTIGICMPNASEEWSKTAAELKQTLEKAGYRTEISYGNGTPQGQAVSLQALLEKQVSCILLEPLDSSALVDAEKLAKEKGIPLVAYNSLLMNTDAVKGYICHDYTQMGVQVATKMIERLNPTKDRAGTCELFMDSPANHNSLLFYQGILQVLQPYLDEGSLSIPSGRVAFEDCCIASPSQSAVEQDFRRRLTANRDQAVDMYFCGSDLIASYVYEELEREHIQALISGGIATEQGLEMVQKGYLTLTVRANPEDLVTITTSMLDYILLGATPGFTVKQINNNVVDVPTVLCNFEIIIK